MTGKEIIETKKILQLYRPEEFAALEYVSASIIGIGPSKSDGEILESWASWFKHKNFPFAIIQADTENLEIWKEDA